MNDTNTVAELKMRELVDQKSPEEKLKMGCSMFMFAKALVKASLEQKGPIPANILKQRLFLRFYGDDFEDAQKNKILEHLNKH